MGKIQLLDQHTINKIAAGEVIERPAAVVKELIENAIDANASAITIEIKDGGVTLIRVTDNGNGINKNDISTAFLRHSTSKIKSMEDLLTVSSLGFRGEALASIAAVSNVEVITKTNHQLTGVRYIIEGGIEKSIEDIGCPEGTTILVRQLFYNTPARRKFLKSNKTEAGYVSDLVNKIALSHSEISFKFIYNNTIKLHTSGNNKLKDVIFSIYGKEIAKNILQISHKIDKISFEGFIGKPQICRSNRNFENYYINGRVIKSKLIQKAIEEGYSTYLPIHKYPFTALRIGIDSSLIDVNVHPTKMEIRFKNSDELFKHISDLVKQALKQSELIPEVLLTKPKNDKTNYKKFSIPEPFEKSRIKEIKEVSTPRKPFNNELSKEINQIKNNSYTKSENNTLNNSVSIKNDTLNNSIPIKKEKENDSPTKKIEKPNSIPQNNISVKEQIKIKEPLLSKSSLPYYQIIGQLFNTYWIIEFKKKFYIIDQHAAHERVLYEKIIKDIKNSKIISQSLLQPIVLQISMREKNIIEQYITFFKQLGFELEPFGKDTYVIRSVPYMLNNIANLNYFNEMLDLLSDIHNSTNSDLLLEKIALMACKAAVKANDKISIIEAKKLIEELLLLDNPYTCPHGRPTIISMTQYELEKKFKRIQ